LGDEGGREAEGLKEGLIERARHDGEVYDKEAHFDRKTWNIIREATQFWDLKSRFGKSSSMRLCSYSSKSAFAGKRMGASIPKLSKGTPQQHLHEESFISNPILLLCS